jgi:hypothetical protein
MSKLSKSILSKKRKIPKLSAYQQLEEEEELDKRRRPDSDQDFSFFEEEQTHAQPPEQYLQQQYQPEIVQGFPQSRSTLPTFQQQQQQQQQQEQEQQQSQPFTFGKSLSQESLEEEEEEPEVVWAIDRKPLKILEHGKSEEWTKVVDSRWPIWSIIQTDSKPKHTTDTHQRIIHDEGIHIRPPVPVVKLYNFICNINNIYVSDTSQCATTAFVQNKHTSAADSKAFDTCCGFTAPITTGILFLLDKICKITDFIQPGNQCNFVKHIIDGVVIEHKDEEMPVNLININEKLFRFYMFISGYAHIKDLGWNERCPPIHFLIEGINLVSITGPISPQGTCSTYHHFTVFVITIDGISYAIITDTWAGGEHGCRDPWVRIMYTEHLQGLFTTINDNSKNHRELTKLFKIYFNAPDIKGSYNVENDMKVGILNGPNLEDMIWKYMNPVSNLARRPTMKAHAEHNMTIDIPTEPSSPVGSPRIPQFTRDQLQQLIHALGELSQDQGQGFGIKRKLNKKTKRKPRRKSQRKTQRKTQRKRSKSNKKIKKEEKYR